MPGSKHSCKEPDFEELSAYLDGELSPERMMEIDAWLAKNPASLRKLRRIRSLEGKLSQAFRSGLKTKSE